MERSQGHLPISNHAHHAHHADLFHRTSYSQCNIQPNAQCSSQSSTPEFTWNDLWQYFHVGMEAQATNHGYYVTAIQIRFD